MYKLSEIQIKDNIFVENGPVTTFKEIEFSPYYKYLAMQQKVLTMNSGGPCTFAVENEFQYFESCFNQIYSIDLPPLLGTIYIQNCDDV